MSNAVYRKWDTIHGGPSGCTLCRVDIKLRSVYYCSVTFILMSSKGIVQPDVPPCTLSITDLEAATPPEVVVVHVAPHDVDGTVALPAHVHAGMGDALEGYVRSVSPKAGYHLKYWNFVQSASRQ